MQMAFHRKLPSAGEIRTAISKDLEKTAQLILELAEKL